MNPLLSIKRHLTPAQINVYFSIFCFFCPPVLGSAVSFVFIGGGLWSGVLLALKRRRFNFDPPMLAITVAIYVYCAAYLLASAVNNALGADAPHLVALVTFLLFPISYSTWSITAKATLARIVVVASMAACFGALVLAVVQYYWLGMRAEGGAGNAIPFATVTCLGVMMCMAGALSGIERAKGLLIPAVLAGIIAILYSGTRIIWVAIPVSGIAVLLINRRRLEQASLARLLLIAAVMSLVIAILGFHIVSERADFLFSDWDALAKGDHATPTGLRVALWQIGLGAFRDAPIFGHGIAASQALMKQGFHDQFGMAMGFSHFHNGFLTALVQAGLAGAITLAAIFAVAAWNAAKVLRVSADPIERFGATMVAVTVIVYLIGGMTGILLGHDILDSTFMVFVVSGTYLASGRQQRLPQEPAAAIAPAT
ncbi:MAG: O-antigen ligase family protein [Mesorhizobium sp.]|uniref:O-antigen ligase family protein n=2 Tax=Mesorhizobium TaxID=68287 RepID=UPI000F75482D|nr:MULTISPECIES: O-antigen ligase [unclassified Mesorhizobium]AZO48369.1 O-antigen ligase family protein [Mesorhizobium sp. M4B.F.Ca.ET.058.02.1.1]RVC40030.1 O-antigen ligase family protein [Mesorhizobium sp. M4A.F.Ca.ET.090.04.2.1]RWC37329.1 MAG: O-antigen ligase family protein [Mesorhizobium sp.]RWD04126.1 MAG: O-antigen ligase family protein [Mesorhizobium sp.]RWD15392.1 MAG: O-antigen ligase family protein [Mesorhizobium sp.]